MWNDESKPLQMHLTFVVVHQIDTLLQLCRALSMTVGLRREALQSLPNSVSPSKSPTLPQWRIVTRILDRLCLLIHLAVLIICYSIMFPTRKMIWTVTEFITVLCSSSMFSTICFSYITFRISYVIISTQLSNLFDSLTWSSNMLSSTPRSWQGQ